MAHAAQSTMENPKTRAEGASEGSRKAHPAILQEKEEVAVHN